MAYAAQEAWIQNGTVEENIRCGLPMDAPFYDEVRQRRWRNTLWQHVCMVLFSCDSALM